MSRLDKPQQDLDTASPTASLSERIATPDRRRFLKAAAVGSAAAVAAPWVGNVQAQQGIRIRMQSSWQPGTTGYRIFEEWAAGVAEATSALCNALSSVGSTSAAAPIAALAAVNDRRDINRFGSMFVDSFMTEFLQSFGVVLCRFDHKAEPDP